MRLVSECHYYSILTSQVANWQNTQCIAVMEARKHTGFGI